MKILLCLISSIFFFSCDSNNNSTSPTNSSYEETKMTLEEQENSNPLGFLEAKGTYRKNLIDQWVLEGTITNTATLATYKDVILRIVYYSKTNTEMGAEDKTIFEYFKPKSKQEFKVKTNGFDNAKSIGFQILSANTAN